MEGKEQVVMMMIVLVKKPAENLNSGLPRTNPASG